jgi:L-lysine 2,3-aminomutase
MITASVLSAQPLPPQSPRWQREWREAITDPHELLALLGLPQLAYQVLALPRGAFPLRVPRAFAARMRHGDPADPLLRQVLPVDLEQRIVPGFALDAVGDLDARGATGVLHKYSGRALLVATGSCAVHCRYCFRRHFPYAEETAAANRWREAIEYLDRHPELDELILSGGDPLSLTTAKLDELTQALRDRPRIQRLRIHTRLPVVLPARVDAPLLDWLRGLPQQVIVVIHANHANEIDAEVASVLQSLRDQGTTLLNQTVLLRGINDTLATLEGLSRRLFAVGVLPYYLHQLDRVQGTAHFEVPDDSARSLLDRLRGRLPGYLVPRLVREIAGADAKTPL